MPNNNPIAENPISAVSISSPYMLFKFFEGTGADVVAETNIAGATTTWPITGGGGVTWSTKALAITPDTTTDTYIVDPDFDATVDTNESAFESLMRTDDAFATMFIAFTAQMSAIGGPLTVEDYISMGDNVQTGHPLIYIQEDTNGNMKLLIDHGPATQQVQVDVADFTATDNNTFLFAVNKTGPSSGSISAYVNGLSSPSNTTLITGIWNNTPPDTAGRDPALFMTKSTGVVSRVLNSTGSRVVSIDNLLVLKSQTTLTEGVLQNICDGLNEYKGDKPWVLNNV